MAADRVDFVDEDDAGRVLLGLLEHVAHAAGADADEHLDEVGARDGEERHVRFARDGAREQRLAGAGRADQQHAARNAPAELLELAGVAQELDDLLQVLLRLVDAGDVLERHPAVRLGEQLRARLAEAERLAARPLHLARQENPHADQRDERQPREQQRHEPGHVLLLRPRRDRDALLVEALDQRRIVGRIGLEAAAVRVGAVNFRPLDHDVAHASLVDLVEQLRERDVLRGGPLPLTLEQGEQCEQQQDDDDPQGKVTKIGVHSASLSARRRPGGLLWERGLAQLDPPGANVGPGAQSAKGMAQVSLTLRSRLADTVARRTAPGRRPPRRRALDGKPILVERHKRARQCAAKLPVSARPARQALANRIEQGLQLAEFDRSLIAYPRDRAAEQAQRHLRRQAPRSRSRSSMIGPELDHCVGDRRALWRP